MDPRETWIRNQISDICRRLDRKGFVANHDGNVTVRDGELIYATPTGEAKADMTPEMVIVLDRDGKKVSGVGKPFSELGLHLAAYAAREDVKSVVHAHPPYATARGLAGRGIDSIGIPEAIVSIGDCIPVAEFAMPGDEGNAEIIAEAFSERDVVVLPGNGVLTIGDAPLQAYLRLELVEHVCRIYAIAEQSGEEIMTLSANQIESLMQKRAAAGFRVPTRYQSHGHSHESGNPPSYPDLTTLVTEEVRNVLNNFK